MSHAKKKGFNIFFIAAHLMDSHDHFRRADNGATIWGSMYHSHSGAISANILKVAPNQWKLTLMLSSPTKAKEYHPGFPWRFTDAEAFEWIKTSAHYKQPCR